MAYPFQVILHPLSLLLSRLKGTEQSLRRSVESQGADINQFIALMKENQKVLVQLHKIQQQRIMQDMIKAVMRADNKNPDFYIDMQEMEELILRMRHLHGVTFDEKTFRILVQEKSVGFGLRRKTSVGACLEVALTMLESKNTPKFYGKNQILENESVRNLVIDNDSVMTPTNAASSVAFTDTTAGTCSNASKKVKFGLSFMKSGKKKKKSANQAESINDSLPTVALEGRDGELAESANTPLPATVEIDGEVADSANIPLPVADIEGNDGELADSANTPNTPLSMDIEGKNGELC
jgi:hypothetical protein